MDLARHMVQMVDDNELTWHIFALQPGRCQKSCDRFIKEEIEDLNDNFMHCRLSTANMYHLDAFEGPYAQIHARCFSYNRCNFQSSSYHSFTSFDRSRSILH